MPGLHNVAPNLILNANVNSIAPSSHIGQNAAPTVEQAFPNASGLLLLLFIIIFCISQGVLLLHLYQLQQMYQILMVQIFLLHLTPMFLCFFILYHFWLYVLLII
jgi:hypothetical protein